MTSLSWPKLPALYAASLLLVSSCTGDTAVEWIIALASVPQVGPVGFVATVSADRRSVALDAVLRNFGYNDAKNTAFDVRMAVTGYGIHVPGQLALTVTQEHQITVPASTVVPGHHGTGTLGPVVGLPSVIGGMPFDPTATYDVYIVVDEKQTAFGGANAAVNTYFFKGKLP